MYKILCVGFLFGGFLRVDSGLNSRKRTKKLLLRFGYFEPNLN